MTLTVSISHMSNEGWHHSENMAMVNLYNVDTSADFKTAEKAV